MNQIEIANFYTRLRLLDIGQEEIQRIKDCLERNKYNLDVTVIMRDLLAYYIEYHDMKIDTAENDASRDFIMKTLKSKGVIID